MRRLITTAIAVLATVAAPSFTYAQAREGVVVHGHWTIEIRNPDGSLAGRHEFENALTADGQRTMAALFTRGTTILTWAVSAGDQPICSAAGSPVQCAMVEPILGPGTASRDLSVTFDSNSRTTRLAGSFTVATAGSIPAVETVGLACAYPIANLPIPPGALECNAVGVVFSNGSALLSLPAFSRRVLPSPINVQAGQIVQVTVTFSFS